MENPKDILIRQAHQEELVRRYVAANLQRQIYGTPYRRTMRDLRSSAIGVTKWPVATGDA